MPEVFKIYVAGSWCDKETIRKYQKSLLERIPNSVITHDWTSTEESDWNLRTLEDNDKYAQLDLWEGVAKADCVVVIKTDKNYAYRGTEREIGFAQGRNIPVYVLAHNDPESYVYKNIFHHLTKGQKTFENWDQLIAALTEFSFKTASTTSSER